MILYINKIIKDIRAKVIKKHLDAIGTNKCICFTCGNATISLRSHGINVISIGDNEELKTNKWWTYSEIQKYFGLFDATSGHLPLPLINDISIQVRDKLNSMIKDIDEIIDIPTGSGESLLIMCMAFPKKRFRSIRLNNKETVYNIDAPLNHLVEYLDNIARC